SNPPAILTPAEWGVILPFRWLEIEGWSGELQPEQVIRQSAFSRDWNDAAADFECSDDMLNRIWDLCKYSIKATTFAGVYVDGDRERIPYEADAYLNQLSHYYTDSDIQVARDTVDHLLNYPTWPSEWPPHMVFMVYADWMHTGDTEWMGARYEALKSTTLADRKGNDGLVATTPGQIKKGDIVDWPIAERDGYVFTARNTVVNAFHLRAIERMAMMADALGRKNEAEQFRKDYQASLQAFQKTFFNPDTGLYVDGVETDHSSLHANLFPLAFGLVPDEHKDNIAEWLAGRGMKCSVYAAQYLMEALFENGRAAAALELMTAGNDRSWRHMVESGTTITWEAWDQKYKPNQDWNHAWGAAPANLLPRYLLGVEAQQPGWATVRIRPNIGTLSFARGKVPTPRGPVSIHWKNAEHFRMDVELPEGLAARVELPAFGNSTSLFREGARVRAARVDGRFVLDVTGGGRTVLEVR
ncbi:alpha-L-rhamnosidase C-terminal domain-containing protein, partial [Pontiella sp.]|uniref:alpha-L-rhamnosidase-related protein n=1 Tax=Pontiella sp. TaxID=2837462 RepID=UPI0035686E2D